jgi:hypothetical protein
MFALAFLLPHVQDKHMVNALAFSGLHKVVIDVIA